MRKAIRLQTVRHLFALSGNQCAFPGCDHPLIDDDGEFVAQICHIEAASPDGQRYNPSMSDDERSSKTNLILFCYRHHIKTNNINIYIVDALRRIKAEHEAKFSKQPYLISGPVLERIIDEQFQFWSDVERISTSRRAVLPEAIEIPVTDDLTKYIDRILSNSRWLYELTLRVSIRLNSLPKEISQHLTDIGINAQKFDDQAHYKNPFYGIEWEALNIGADNTILHIIRDCLMTKIAVLEMRIRSDPENSQIQDALQALRSELKKLALHGTLID